MYCGTKSGDLIAVSIGAQKYSSRFFHKEFGQLGVTTVVFCEDKGSRYLLAGDGHGTVALIEVNVGSDRPLLLLAR